MRAWTYRLGNSNRIGGIQADVLIYDLGGGFPIGGCRDKPQSTATTILNSALNPRTRSLQFRGKIFDSFREQFLSVIPTLRR